MRNNIILTGLPKSGKSTLLNRIISEHQDKVGMVTNEILEQGQRTGFCVETSAGKKSVIASVNFSTDFQVSKYFVNLENLELILPEINKFDYNNLLFIDEIGQMQLPSDKFRQLVVDYFDSDNIVLATLSKVFNNDFTNKLRDRKDIIIIEISEENRNETEGYVRALIGKILKAKKYISDPSRISINNDQATIRTDHGLRHLKNIDSKLICECDFFEKYGICSHVITLEEYLRKKD
ncbi:MAG: nucleoside-triphosphatase [Patescibacteria group bacterium]|jgi:nucleoside-triphosphatase THEP1